MIALVNWQYIILRWPVNGVYRVKKRTDGPPPVPDTGTETVNKDFWSRTAPSDRMYNNEKYDFAFWSITAQDMLSPQREAHIDGITAYSSHPGPSDKGGGMWIITAKAYYVRDIQGGYGDHGVFIDAFDIQAGDFIPDDFVDVSPDDSAKSFTIKANNGYIDTTTDIEAGKAIKITSRDYLPSGESFGYWQDVPTVTVSAELATPATVGAPDPHDIVAHKNDIIYAFAFYNEVGRIDVRIPGPYEIYDPWWWIKTHWGTTPPLPDPEPWLPQFAAAMALAVAAKKVSSRLRTSVLEIALQQLSIASATIKKEIKTQGK